MLFSFVILLTYNDLYYQSFYYYYDIKHNKKTRRPMKDVVRNLGKSNLFNKFLHEKNSQENFHYLNRGSIVYRKIKEQVNEVTKNDPILIALQRAIEQSQTYNSILRYSDNKKSVAGFFKNFTETLKEISNGLFDSKVEISADLRGLFTYSFGNSIGSIKTRAGKLKNKEAILDEILLKLKPLDVLLEKTPKVSSMLIGTWGHAAIWLGTYEELSKVSGLMEKIQEEIGAGNIHKNAIEFLKQGKGLVEAIKPGVMQRELKHFMDIDDLLIIKRKKHFTDDEITAAVLYALKKVGHDYNYEFTSYNSKENLYCSQLVYNAYKAMEEVRSDVKIPFDRFKGALYDKTLVIKPVHFASLSVGEDRSFIPRVLYLHGEKVPHEEVNKTLEKLLNITYDSGLDIFDISPYAIFHQVEESLGI